jgi:oligosaccharyltransferase complex subunit delta (ribophorin II)
MVCVFLDDGTFYFDEKNVDATEYKGPITTSASVVRGVTSFTNVVSGKLNVGCSHFTLVLFH